MACVVAAREKSRGWGVYTGRERDVREGNCEDKSEKKGLKPCIEILYIFLENTPKII